LVAAGYAVSSPTLWFRAAFAGRILLFTWYCEMPGGGTGPAEMTDGRHPKEQGWLAGGDLRLVDPAARADPDGHTVRLRRCGWR